MTEEEILETLNTVEVRTGLERTIKSYALRNNRLEEGQRELALRAWDRYCLAFRDEMTDPRSLFSDPSKPVVVEIGFGMGAVTQVIAKERDQYNYLGLEVYLQGFMRLLRDVEKLGLDNIKLMRFNAVDVLERMIPDGTIEGFHIFFPDPWQKSRHHKRRLIQGPFVNLLAKKLRKGGYIFLATDWEEYAEWMLEVLGNEPLLKNPYGGYCEPHVGWRPETKFERKGLDKDHVIRELWYERV